MDSGKSLEMPYFLHIMPTQQGHGPGAGALAQAPLQLGATRSLSRKLRPRHWPPGGLREPQGHSLGISTAGLPTYPFVAYGDSLWIRNAPQGADMGVAKIWADRQDTPGPSAELQGVWLAPTQDTRDTGDTCLQRFLVPSHKP